MHHGAPQLQLLFIVCLSGTVAFLVSASWLWLGLSSMTVRYTFAAVSGYLTFLVLIRAWIAWQRGRWDPEVDIDPEILSVDFPHDVTATADAMFAGGRSGGAGASGQWTAGSPGGATQQPGMGGHLDVDLDELWPIAVAAICAIGGLIAVVYVVYSAPLLLAEVALDGAVVTALYRRLRHADSRHWATTTLRRTWMPAAVLIVSATITGFVFDRIAPEASSIGGVIRYLQQ